MTQIPHREFKTSWEFSAERRADGVLVADPDRISAATLVLIREELEAMHGVLKKISNILSRPKRKKK